MEHSCPTFLYAKNCSCGVDSCVTLTRVGHSCRKIVGHPWTLGHSCGTLYDTFVGHSCGALLSNNLAGLFVRHSCGTAKNQNPKRPHKARTQQHRKRQATFCATHKPTQGALQCVHLCMSSFFKLHRSILLKVSRKQVRFVRKRRSNDSRKANEPIVDSIGPKGHPSDVQPF